MLVPWKDNKINKPLAKLIKKKVEDSKLLKSEMKGRTLVLISQK